MKFLPRFGTRKRIFQIELGRIVSIKMLRKVHFWIVSSSLIRHKNDHVPDTYEERDDFLREAKEKYILAVRTDDQQSPGFRIRRT